MPPPHNIYSKPDINNDEIIPKLKALLSNCSSQRKCTIFINYDKPKELSPEITADHRFDKIDVTDIKYKYKPKFKPYYKDYKMKYGITNDDVVELFCGNWGYNDKVLWINSRRTKDINAVLDNIIAIKELKKFKGLNINISSDKEINAFILPNGKIYFTKGMLKNLKTEEYECSTFNQSRFFDKSSKL